MTQELVVATILPPPALPCPLVSLNLDSLIQVESSSGSVDGVVGEAIINPQP